MRLYFSPKESLANSSLGFEKARKEKKPFCPQRSREKNIDEDVIDYACVKLANV